VPSWAFLRGLEKNNDGNQGRNPWKGTKAPPWRKAKPRQDRGKLQKGILAAFESKPAGTRLSTSDLIRAVYPTFTKDSREQEIAVYAFTRARLRDEWCCPTEAKCRNSHKPVS